jgi:hypothetical protein
VKSELRSSILVSVAALTSILISVLTAYAVAESASYTLAAPERFSSIGGINKRSAALFTELGAVLTNPRCVNCHPAGDRPRQGDLSRLHQPPVYRGSDGFGLETMRCPVCHQSANFEPGRMPRNGILHRLEWGGKERRSGRIVCRSRILRATVAVPWRTSYTTLAPTIWLAGPGPLGLADSPLREPRRKPAP